jgi:hypothetical protein
LAAEHKNSDWREATRLAQEYGSQNVVQQIRKIARSLSVTQDDRSNARVGSEAISALVYRGARDDFFLDG